MRAASAAGADMVECRLDYLTDCDEQSLAQLLENPPLPTIVTCRPVRQGGKFAGDESSRLALLTAAVRLGADYVDVEMDVDDARRPTGRTILSHHDFTGRPPDLDAITDALRTSRAEVYKVAFTASGPEDALAALEVLRYSPKPAIALAMGPHGLASRILPGKFGAFGTFAALEPGAEAAPGQLTVEEMKGLYRWDAIGPATAVYGVVGCPVGHSMSPAVHNAAFAVADVDAVYVPLRTEPGPESFNRFLDALDRSPWAGFRGLSVTIPHKENALARVGPARVDELSRRIGALNTIRIEPDGSLRGWNTDYAAAVEALVSAMGITPAELAGREVAVVGAGGVGRALVAALRHHGAEVTIYNRTLARAEKLAAEFGAKAFGLDRLAETAAEILVNCTSVGMTPDARRSPVPAKVIARLSVVFDTIYNPPETRLLRQGREAGCLCVSGVEMFINQAARQFEIWTGQPAPREVMRRALARRLTEPKR